MRKSPIVWLTLTLLLALGALAQSQNKSHQALTSIPVFDTKDRLVLPADLDQWVHLGTMLGPQYVDGEIDPEAPGNFHAALMEPSAYRAFLDTGEFPDGTMFALRFYNALNELSIQRSGFLMGNLTLTEIHLKDSTRFPNGFNFYVYPPGQEKAEANPLPNDCVDCHTKHGAYDGVFAQFYPALRDKIPPEALKKALADTRADIAD